MPVATDVLIRSLRESRGRLGSWIDGLLPNPASQQVAVATPDQIMRLLSELRRTGEWLRQLPADRQPELEEELRQYRILVERLRDLLPSVQAVLLRERARLQQLHERVGSAAEWAVRSRDTL